MLSADSPSVRLVALLALFVVAGCSSKASSTPSANDGGLAVLEAGDSADGAPPIDPQVRAAAQTACTMQANAYCAKLEACYPVDLAIQFNDVASCAAAFALTCTPGLLAKGSLTKPSDVDACTAAIPGADCAALFGRHSPPDACKSKPGALATGAACAFDAQCTGGFCAPEAGACGVCGRRATAGEPCTDTTACDYGLVCGSAGCVAPGKPQD